MRTALPSDIVLRLADVSKSFTLHLQGGQHLPVLNRVSLEVRSGECVVLGGRSGAGKSSVLRMVYGGYAVDSGSILLRHEGDVVDLATAPPRLVLAARRKTMGYVSQFLRAVPRVSAVDVVAAPLLEAGTQRGAARQRAMELLDRLQVPERLWQLPPATFSGGEQQRVGVARGFVTDRPLLLLDEPTASLDHRNRGVVIELIRERVAAGAGVLAIFHDAEVRNSVADSVVDIERFSPTSMVAA